MKRKTKIILDDITVMMFLMPFMMLCSFGCAYIYMAYAITEYMVMSMMFSGITIFFGGYIYKKIWFH